MSELTSQIANELAQSFSNPNAVKIENLNDALRLLSKWRSVLIQNTLLNNQGTKVLQGPLSGMELPCRQTPWLLRATPSALY